VTVRPPDMVETAAKQIERMDGVESAKYGQDVVEHLFDITRLVRLFGVLLILLLGGATIFIIANTIRLTVFARRREIAIMKYVGAGDFIVRGPFVIEGMLIGLIGSLIPLALIYVLYGEAVEYFSSKFSILSMFLQFYSPAVIFQKLMPITLGVGVGIGILGSLSSVRRHLNV